LSDPCTSPTSAAPADSTPEELGAMVQSLSEISRDLLESYERLERRAERVEQELCLANRELEQKVAEVETILDTLPVGVVVRDAGDRVARTNGALSTILGLDSRDSAGAPETDLPRPNPDGEPIRWTRPDGSERVLTSQRSSIRFEGGEAAGSVDVFDDRTELVRLSARVHQMDKMAALGNMAAGIAHEIRNPMNAVKGFADLFQRELDPADDHYRWAKLISEGVREVDAIITSLLSFARPDGLQLQEIDPALLLDAAVAAALQRTPGERPASDWEIRTECAAGPFRGDHIKLRQALRNLVSNALDVQPEGGALRVSITERGDEVLFEVQDAGPGIPPELAGSLTDPFFTTRAEGTGLGLSLVHTLVALHGGRLDIDATPSALGGARISFQVPTSPLR